MDFYLKYDGPLKSNGSAKDKHDIREYFYPQLKRLWDTERMRLASSDLLSFYSSISVQKNIDDVIFAPIISSKLKFICHLDIIILWPEEQGVISKIGGDIDNRLKTLFNALQCPDANQIKPVKDEFADKQPYFCLLENDKLITSVNIKTHKLLLEKGNDVSVLIHVIIKSTMPIWDTHGLSG